MIRCLRCTDRAPGLSDLSRTLDIPSRYCIDYEFDRSEFQKMPGIAHCGHNDSASTLVLASLSNFLVVVFVFACCLLQILTTYSHISVTLPILCDR